MTSLRSWTPLNFATLLLRALTLLSLGESRRLGHDERHSLMMTFIMRGRGLLEAKAIFGGQNGMCLHKVCDHDAANDDHDRPISE